MADIVYEITVTQYIGDTKWSITERVTGDWLFEVVPTMVGYALPTIIEYRTQASEEGARIVAYMGKAMDRALLDTCGVVLPSRQWTMQPSTF